MQFMWTWLQKSMVRIYSHDGNRKTNRRRKKNCSIRCAHKLSQIKLIKVQSSSFDKFNGFQINVVHMKSISVEVDLKKKTTNIAQTKCKKITSFFCAKYEKYRH